MSIFTYLYPTGKEKNAKSVPDFFSPSYAEDNFSQMSFDKMEISSILEAFSITVSKLDRDQRETRNIIQAHQVSLIFTTVNYGSNTH